MAKSCALPRRQQQIKTLYHPYHAALRMLVEETAAAFVFRMLIDYHSMPSAASRTSGADAPDIVLGDCHGAACAPQIVEAARRFLAGRGFAVALNAPYAGGFTTGHYGRPWRARHALQIEINRAIYMDERNYRRKPRFQQLAEEMSGLIDRLGQTARQYLAPGC